MPKKSYLSEFNSNYSDLTRFADTREFFVAQAYSDAVKANLLDKDGQVDYNLLDNSGVRTKVFDAMQGALADKSVQHFKAGQGLDWLKKEQLMLAYAGMTGGQLKTVMERQQGDFTMSALANMAAGLRRNAVETLLASTYSHVPETVEARKSIIDELKLTQKLDPAKARLEDLISFMQDAHRQDITAKRSPAYLAPNQP
ncbi:MAG: hypothetical protein V1702_05715 [Candidatus Woesearchaeota archaeon]